MRVPATIEICLDKGLDIQEWVKQGLVDFVSIGVHWKGNTSLPIAQFKKDLGRDDIPVYGSIDDGGFTPREVYSHGTFSRITSYNVCYTKLLRYWCSFLFEYLFLPEQKH